MWDSPVFISVIVKNNIKLWPTFCNLVEDWWQKPDWSEGHCGNKTSTLWSCLGRIGKYNTCILILMYSYKNKWMKLNSVADPILTKDYHNVQLVQTYCKEIRLTSLSTTFNGMNYEYHINENRLRSLWKQNAFEVAKLNTIPACDSLNFLNTTMNYNNKSTR